MVAEWACVVEAHGLKVNTKGTGVMRAGKVEEEPLIDVLGEELNQKKEFVCLRSTLSATGVRSKKNSVHGWQ